MIADLEYFDARAAAPMQAGREGIEDRGTPSTAGVPPDVYSIRRSGAMVMNIAIDARIPLLRDVFRPGVSLRILLVALLLAASSHEAQAQDTGEIFWTNIRGIHRTDLATRSTSTILNVTLSAADGIAVDTLAGKMYWTDQGTRALSRANLDGSNVEILISSTSFWVPFLKHIDLDLQNGKIYWTAPGYYSIGRSNLDGSDYQTIIEDVNSADGIAQPRGIAVDVQGGKVYWTDHGIRTIERANLDGSDREILVSTALSIPEEIALDVQGGKMYWTDSGTLKVERANFDGSEREVIAAVAQTGPNGISVDPKRGRIYWVDQNRYIYPTGPAVIWSANLDGSDRTLLVTTALSKPSGITLDVNAGLLYWTDGNTIQRVKLDGSARETRLRSDMLLPDHITIDRSSGKMYWADHQAKTIERANLDGSAREILISTENTTVDAIALDPSAGKMYWIDTFAKTIKRANLDGTTIETVISAELNEPNDLAIDPLEGKVYWSDCTRHTLERANLNGTDREVLLKESTSAPAIVCGPIDVDLRAGKVYWGGWRPQATTIASVNLDGTDQQMLRSVFEGLYSIALDVEAGKMYWIEGYASINRTNLNGSIKVTLMKDLTHASSLAIYVPPTDTGIDVESPSETPTDLALLANYPNPFRSASTIEYTLPEPGPVSMKVYDVLGREVATLVDRELPAGTHQVMWKDDVPAGVYLVRLEAGGQRRARSIVKAE